MIRLTIVFMFCALAARAEDIVPVRTIPAHTLIGPEDLSISGTVTEAAISLAQSMVGMEAQVALFAGRAIRPADVGPPAIVERNQIIPLLYANSGLVIATDGRALARARAGETIRVMNIGSRKTVTATIDESGAAYVR